jgi:hypothetical protein
VAIKSGNIDNIMLFFLQIEDVLDERRSYYVYSPMFPDFMATLYIYETQVVMIRIHLVFKKESKRYEIMHNHGNSIVRGFFILFMKLCLPLESTVNV